MFEDTNTKPKKKMTGPFFYMMVVIALMKDFLDFVLTLTVVFSILIIPINILIYFIIILYLFLSGVKFGIRKISVIAGSFMVEMLPIIGLLPMATMNLFIIKSLENNEYLKNLSEKLL